MVLEKGFKQLQANSSVVKNFSSFADVCDQPLSLHPILKRRTIWSVKVNRVLSSHCVEQGLSVCVNKER